MQCYERQAMYLKLNSDAIKEIPHFIFDPILLDEVLSDFSICSFDALIELDKEQIAEIIKYIKVLTRIEDFQKGAVPAGREHRENKKYSVTRFAVSRGSAKGLTTSPTLFP